MQSGPGRAKRTIKPPRRLYEDDGTCLSCGGIVCLVFRIRPGQGCEQAPFANLRAMECVLRNFLHIISDTGARVSSRCIPKHRLEAGGKGPSSYLLARTSAVCIWSYAVCLFTLIVSRRGFLVEEACPVLFILQHVGRWIALAAPLLGACSSRAFQYIVLEQWSSCCSQVSMLQCAVLLQLSTATFSLSHSSTTQPCRS